MKTCGKETRYYTKYKWYSKKWITKICGETSGHICEECSAYNKGYQDALNVGDKDTPNKNQLQRIKTKTDILKDALNVKEVLK